MVFRISIDSRALVQGLVNEAKAQRDRAFGAMRRAGAFHVRSMTRRFVPYGQSDPIQSRSGALRRAIGFEHNNRDEVRIFAAGLPYIRVQEYGGEIRPRRRKFLTVPLPAALTPAGVLKGGARLVKRGDHYETADGKRTVIFTGPSGGAIIGIKRGKDKITPLYVLKSSVRLKPRLGFLRTFEKETMPFLDKELGGAG